jgi:hypothetical protein
MVQPEQHGIPGLGPTQLPAYVVGQIGLGRVVCATILWHHRLAEKLPLPVDYFKNLFSRLAEPRRINSNDASPTAPPPCF